MCNLYTLRPTAQDLAAHFGIDVPTGFNAPEDVYPGAPGLVMHNHPSGDPTPSTADVDMTRQVVDAARPMRIAVHDHLIAARDGVASLKALGLM